jgi:hypothetical protein
VITWKDFVFDDVMGPVMMDQELPHIPSNFFSTDSTSCRRTRLGSPVIMEDETGKIQETRQEKRPARMVGCSNFDSFAEPHMDVSRGHRDSPRQRGEA